jgi:hypothetical protein
LPYLPVHVFLCFVFNDSIRPDCHNISIFVYRLILEHCHVFTFLPLSLLLLLLLLLFLLSQAYSFW